MGNRADPRFNDADARIIRHKVRKLIGHYGWRRSDTDDLQQELAMHVATHMDRYDPDRGTRGAFVDRIVANKIANIVEHRTARKRDRRKDRQLDDVSEWDLRDQTQPEHNRDLASAVHAAIGGLPDDLRPVALLLMQMGEAEVIRQTGLSRQKVRGMKRQIEQHLREMGLGRES